MIRRARRAVTFAAGVVLGTGLMIFAKLASESVIDAAERWADRIAQGRNDRERDRLAGQ